MKKTPAALFVVFFVASVCFAEELPVLSSATNSSHTTQASGNAPAPAQAPNAPAAPAQVPESAVPAAPAGITTFTGKVDSISSGDVSGAKPQITLENSEGEGTTFTVASDATIIDKDGSPIALDWIIKDDKVSVGYITNQDGSRMAKSIKVSADW